MTGSLDEVRATLYAVLELLTSAQQHAGVARTKIEDAVGMLSVLGEQHSEPLPPPQLVRASERLQDGLGLIGSGAQLVADIGARL